MIHSSTSASQQAALFNRIAEDYSEHYSDVCSQQYRAEFFNPPMLQGLDLYDKNVLEAMCGSGQTTECLLSLGANVTGLDISARMVELFQKKYCDRAQAVCRSVLETGFENKQFDAVVLVGGLHHLHPQVDEALDEVHRVLKPGGHFCFVEPHAGALLDTARKLWYRWDPYFEANEASIDLVALERKNAHRFGVERTQYLGNLAYLFVYNSLIFRTPLSWKRRYTNPLMKLERRLAPHQNKRMSCFVAARWRKLNEPS